VDGERIRTFSWSDPLETAMAAASLPGLEAIGKIAAGELPPPPIAELFGFEITLVEPGRVIFALTPAEWMYNPIGSVHGGVAATLLDSSLGCAVHTLVPAGRGYTTAELKVNFVRPITRETPRLRAEAKVIHPGRQLATSEGRIVDARGLLYAHGTATCMIFDVREPR
jgi:uncharacterized protein (TIGR00369 family)